MWASIASATSVGRMPQKKPTLPLHALTLVEAKPLYDAVNHGRNEAMSITIADPQMICSFRDSFLRSMRTPL
jgi:hypothetical protein